jgi:hypothetical protein
MHLPTDYQSKVYAYASANGLNAVSHRTINERNYPNTEPSHDELYADSIQRVTKKTLEKE